MTSSPLAARLVGVQRPRLSSYPRFTSSAGQECVELAASAGVILDDWQAHTLHVTLAERADGKWACVECGLIVPRQNGKGEILLARELAGLFLFDERLIIHTAHEYKTAQEAFIRIKAVVDNTDDLRRKVKAIRDANGEQGIELLNGNRLRFLARSKGSGRGFTADCVVLDEAYALQPAHLGAIRYAMSAVPNMQLWLTSSAGLADSDVLQSVRARALEAIAAGKASGRFGFLEWSALGDAADDDDDAIAQANPALGIRIELETVLDELRAATTPELLTEYRRERLGITEDVSAAAPISEAAWSARADRNVNLVDPVAFALDMTPDRRRVSIVAADGQAIDLVDNRPGSAWVVDRVVELNERWRPCAWAVDKGSPASSFIPDLEAAGITVERFAAADVAAAWGAFYDAVVDEKLTHRDDPTLNAAVAGAKERPLGDAKALGRRLAAADISPLVAATLARWAWQIKHGAGGAPNIW